MATFEGWIKVYRKLLEWGDSDLAGFFLYILMLVQFNDKAKGLNRKKGSLVTSYAELGLLSGKNRKTVMARLQQLEKSGEVVVQRKVATGIIITVPNWSKYQSNERTINGTNNGTNERTVHKNVRKKECNNTTDVVNSSDYFGKSSDLRSSESELRNKDLWDQLLSKWVTSEYATSNDKMFNQYWCNMSLENQQDLLCYVNKCTDSNLNKIWKRSILSTKDPLLYLQAELAKYKPKDDNKYRNPGSEPPVMEKVKVDFTSILNPDGTIKK